MLLIRLRLLFVAYLLRGWKSKINHHVLFKISALLMGYWPDSLLIYRLRAWDRRLLVSDYIRCVRASLLNYPNAFLIDDKLVSEKFFPSAVTSIALIYNRRFIPTSEGGPVSEDELTQAIGQYQRFILKPRTGGGGQGIYILAREEEGAYQIGRERYDASGFLEKILSFHNCLIYPWFDQSGFSSDIYPSTLNTVRMLTIIDKGTGEPILIRALHRFGTERSFPVDNWSAGGICSEIDTSTGALGPAYAFPYDRQMIPLPVHPDSGKQIEGTVIPHWNGIRSQVLRLHRTIQFLPYIGWDMILSEDRIHILEANSNSDVNLFQVHQPLLTDKKVRSVFHDYGIIKVV